MLIIGLSLDWCSLLWSGILSLFLTPNAERSIPILLVMRLSVSLENSYELDKILLFVLPVRLFHHGVGIVKLCEASVHVDGINSFLGNPGLFDVFLFFLGEVVYLTAFFEAPVWLGDYLFRSWVIPQWGECCSQHQEC